MADLEDLNNVKRQIQELEKEKHILEKRFKKDLKERLSQRYEYLFTVIVTSGKYPGCSHYGCFSTFSKAKEVVDKQKTYTSGFGSNSVTYYSNVGVREFEKFSISDLETLDQYVNIWRNYWSD